MMRLIQRLTIPLILLTLFYVFTNLHSGKGFWKHIIASDGKGYYAYLPATFIYHDLNFGFNDAIEEKYYDQNTRGDFRSKYHDEVYIDKYFCGTAFLMTPFFLVAHGTTLATGGAADGYSFYYQMAIGLAAICYLGLGLIYFRKLLRSYQAGNNALTILPIVLVFGTNMFYYAVVECSMSHIYSFAAITMFMWYSRMFVIAHSNRYFLYSAALLGLILLIRPVNGLVLLWVPFAAGSWPKLAEAVASLKKRPLIVLAGGASIVALLSLQLVIYKIQTGSFFIDAYGGESFNFFHPHVLDFLISYKKGLFVYLPITFVSLFGFVYLWKRSRYQAVWLFVFLLALIYVLSSWWSWYYGGSFGTRPMVEFMAVFGLLVLFAVKTFDKKWPRITMTVLLLVLTAFCQLQTYQYRYYIIHWSEMNQEKYWDAFLKVKF